MKTATPKLMKSILTLLAVLMGCLCAQAATIKWTVIIHPAGAGTIDWQTSSPYNMSTLTNSDCLEFDSGSYVDLTFKAKTGYQLTSVTKNTEQWINYLDGNKHARFGPVSKSHVIVAIFTAINPTGQFKMDFPDGKATSVADVTGNYSGKTTRSQRNYDVDVAMDESGKLAAVGTVDGIVPKAGGPIQGTVGSVKTLKDQPTAVLKGSFVGTKDGEPTTASGSCTGPLALTDAGGGSATVTGTASGTAKVGTTPVTVKPTSTNFPVTATQKTNLSKAWSLSLNIRETNSTSARKLVYASATLNLPDGEKTFFKEKKVSFSIKNGYSIAFSKGVKLDDAGNPILNPKTSKPVIDTKSSITITKMLITGSPGHWIVTGGKMSYRFLGQRGKGNLLDFTGSEETILNIGNINAVYNGPVAATTFTISKPYAITYLSTYHWNSGMGTKAPGQLSLQHSDGTTYGPWKATGSPGQGGVRNAYWECRPGVLIKPGTYTVIDSENATWSQNSTSGGRGFSQVRGKS
jgi:hypothetical protein